MKIKTSQCQAWSKSTSTRCPNQKMRWTAYCWHHQSKLPIIISLLIVFAGFVVPIVWNNFIPSRSDKKTHKMLLDIRDEITPQSYNEYYTQMRINYDAGVMYQQRGKERDASTAFLLSKNIALNINQINHAAILSLIASYRFENMGDFSKAGELQAEAGDLYIKLNDKQEAVLWKKAALKNYQKVNIIDKIKKTEKEILKLQRDTAQ